ncbi:formyl transferase [Pararhizobium polonicum]|uniref:phosphoribosylglycinamide formyltransferase 1 n=1 Tax=Pararhizobium polonicum TaxID=1612624 RepID=A0A1C7NY08_9HYPH|nr:formyl transferase [Pararhizobium polonicum]OBZ93878.1 formyl transferase [Pararhizobium polonicum]
MTSAADKPIVIVTAGGRNPQILINAIHARSSNVTVLLEQPESKKHFLKRRIRKLGLVTALGQLATMIASKFGKRFTEKRAAEILRLYDADDRENPTVPVIALDSVNTPSAIEHIRAINPAVVFLVSCRMLSASTLQAMPCPVINFHAGINPQYRGLMGGYWARVENDEGNFGATVHLVDTGVDTGDILYQSRMTPSKSDTMHTYPLLQTAASTDIAIRAIDDALSGSLKPVPANGTSRQWYHPPIWMWLWNGFSRGIW